MTVDSEFEGVRPTPLRSIRG